jgi:hypothetical protein
MDAMHTIVYQYTVFVCMYLPVGYPWTGMYIGTNGSYYRILGAQRNSEKQQRWCAEPGRHVYMPHTKRVLKFHRQAVREY